MTVKNLGDLIIWAGAIAGALGAIGTLIYWVLLRPFVRWLREQITETRATADAVHAEVTPNHGGSMKDAVNRIERDLRQLRQDEVQQLRKELTEHRNDTIRHPGGA